MTAICVCYSSTKKVAYSWTCECECPTGTCDDYYNTCPMCPYKWALIIIGIILVIAAIIGVIICRRRDRKRNPVEVIVRDERPDGRYQRI